MQNFNIEDGRKKQHFWHNMIFCFNKGNNATEMQKKKKKKICAVYGEGAVTELTCQKQFAKFNTGDFSLNNASQLVDHLSQ